MEYGWMMLRTLFVLGAVCALAYGLLRWGLKRFVPAGGAGKGRMEIVDRIGVAPKQSVLVLRVGSRYLLVGSSEAGLQNLGEVSGEDMQSADMQIDAKRVYSPPILSEIESPKLEVSELEDEVA
jgi:flagellar protein FliO/FliZ